MEAIATTATAPPACSEISADGDGLWRGGLGTLPRVRPGHFAQPGIVQRRGAETENIAWSDALCPQTQGGA